MLYNIAQKNINYINLTNTKKRYSYPNIFWYFGHKKLIKKINLFKKGYGIRLLIYEGNKLINNPKYKHAKVFFCDCKKAKCTYKCDRHAKKVFLKANANFCNHANL